MDMAYRRFRASENSFGLATVATTATVQPSKPQTVATFATVAGQKVKNDARLAEGVENSTPLRASPFKVENSTLKPGSDPADWEAYFDERAGIREFDGEMPRAEAERLAAEETVAALGPRPRAKRPNLS
jgi:hypothetical protein